MNNKRHSTNEQLSLDEINNTIKFDHRSSNKQKFLSFLGPGLLVAVGYMDPGNWITSMQGGAQYGYTLLFVILISSLSAMLLQKHDSEIRNSNRYGLSSNDTTLFIKTYCYYLLDYCRTSNYRQILLKLL